MAKTEEELHHELMNRFIDLANTMKDEGAAVNVVSSGMVTASAIYSTFVAVGNKGGWLNEEGVNKMVNSFRQQLEYVQKNRKALSEKSAD